MEQDVCYHGYKYGLCPEPSIDCEYSINAQLEREQESVREAEDYLELGYDLA